VIPEAELERRIAVLVDEMHEQVEAQEMSPLERSFKTWSFEEPDRLLGSFAVFSPKCLEITDVSTREYYTDPLSFYYVQAVAVVRWGNETPLLYGDPYNVEVEAMGGKVEFPEDSQPFMAERLLKKREDLLRLEIPDPESDGRMPVLLELSRMHQRYLGDMVYAPTSCCGPFSMAVELRGYEALLRDIRQDPIFVHDLLEFCCEVAITYGRALLSVHGMSPTIQAAWECLPHVSPDLFHEFALPYLSRCVEALRHPETGGTSTVFYGYGTSLAPDWKSLVRTVCATGLSALPLMEEDIFGRRGYGTLDLSEFKRVLSSMRVVLMTFLHTDTIMDGPPERIKQLVRDFFEAAGRGSGYTASTTIPIGAPREHIQAFVDAFRACHYPVKQG
jgi:uroporphyrinogen decarboxylase